MDQISLRQLPMSTDEIALELTRLAVEKGKLMAGGEGLRPRSIDTALDVARVYAAYLALVKTGQLTDPARL